MVLFLKIIPVVLVRIKGLKIVLKLKPKDIEAFYKKYFVPENIVLGFFGNLEVSALFKKIKKVFDKIVLIMFQLFIRVINISLILKIK